jgi:hypothetical protein
MARRRKVGAVTKDQTEADKPASWAARALALIRMGAAAAAPDRPASVLDRVLHFLARFRAVHIGIAWLVIGALISAPFAQANVWTRWLVAVPMAVLAVLLLLLWITAAHRYRGRG